MKQNINKSENQEDKLQPKIIDGVPVSKVSPFFVSFVKWSTRFLLAVWLLFVIVLIPDFVDKYTTIQPGPVRDEALRKLAENTGGVLFGLPIAVIFIRALSVGINPQSIWFNTQYGLRSNPIMTHVRIKKNKKKKQPNTSINTDRG
jgi:hypothetical protein